MRRPTYDISQEQRDKAASLVRQAVDNGFMKKDIASHCGVHNADISELIGGFRVDSTVYYAILSKIKGLRKKEDGTR